MTTTAASSSFVNIGERTNVTGSAAFKKLIVEGDFAKAVEVARSRGLETLGLAGRDGGKLAKLVDLCLTVPHRETARIQEVHGLLIHLFCEMIDGALYPGGR